MKHKKNKIVPLDIGDSNQCVGSVTSISQAQLDQDIMDMLNVPRSNRCDILCRGKSCIIS